MRTQLIRFLSTLGALVALVVTASVPRAADFVTTPRVEARLVSQSMGVPAAGGTVTLGLHQRIQPGWHTYWRNPGDSGEPTKIAWTLPPGFTASDIVWPYPQRLPFGQLANFGYADEVLLLVEVTVPPGLKSGANATFKGDVSWLVCKEICIPEEATLDLTLPVVDGATTANEDWRQAFDDARKNVPLKSDSFAARFAATDASVTLFFFPTMNRIEKGIGAQFFPYEKGLIKSSSAQIAEQRDGGFAFVLQPGWKLRDAQKRKTIGTIDGVLVFAPLNGGVSQSFEVTSHRGPVPPAAAAAAMNDLPLWQAIVFALLGGLILNLMPCVFPILSMKALALVKAGHAERPWVDGLSYLFGVVTTFTGLAVALLALRAAGEDVGWGFQLQSPLVVAALIYVLVAVGLNLSGVFQISGTAQGAGQSLASQPGVIGAFFTGALAVVVAAPCTAPFMGAAMGFAFTQSQTITVVIFVALGIGLALPWVIFSFSPALIRLMPKPGAWMERLKQFLALPMYGAAAWLVWVLSQEVSPDGLFRVLAGIAALALAAWAFGVAQTRKAEGRPRILSLSLLFVGLGAATGLLAIPFAEHTVDAGPLETAKGALPAERYTAARLAELRNQGRPVFVNLTAAWCVSCLYNEQVALSSNAVADAFRASGAVYLVGDWTNKNAEISALLKQFGREGVPLYLYFPPGGSEPKILPQILTESMILDAIGQTG